MPEAGGDDSPLQCYGGTSLAGMGIREPHEA